MSANPTTSMFEFETPTSEASKDVLFLERLDTFMEKCLGDIRAFAERELRPYEETRRSIAQWHAKYLFQPSVTTTFHDLETSATNRATQIRASLCDTSRILESLSDTSGIQAFLLAVDPNDLADGGFLGGSLIGREFWRGMRGGGDHGARAFKTHCASRLKNGPINGVQVHREAQDRPTSTPPPKGGPARSIKNELYDSVRNALRVASGVRGAEMKWTNPERLDVYGVRLVGWPEGVPAQNPSTLKVNQNKLLLEAIQNGTLKFEKVNQVGIGGGGEDPSRLGSGEVNEDFSWAYDADARLPSPPHLDNVASFHSQKVINQTPVTSNNLHKPGSSSQWTLDHNLVDNTMFSQYNADYTWDGEFSERVLEPSGGQWDGDLQLQAERPRKRQRSEEPFPGKEP